MQYLEQIPDSIKVATSTTPTVMTFMGMPVEQWAYVASAIVSLFFIIEKFPVVYRRMKDLYKWIKSKYAPKE